MPAAVVHETNGKAIVAFVSTSNEIMHQPGERRVHNGDERGTPAHFDPVLVHAASAPIFNDERERMKARQKMRPWPFVQVRVHAASLHYPQAGRLSDHSSLGY